MRRFVDPANIDEELSLLPGQYSTEQLEVSILTAKEPSEFCRLADLAKTIFVADEKSTWQGIDEPCIQLSFGEGSITAVLISPVIDDHLHSRHDAIFLIPRSDISHEYLLNALNTELCQRQFARILQKAVIPRLSIEDVASVLVPKPGGRFWYEFITHQLMADRASCGIAAKSIDFLPSPLSEIDALANAILMTESEMTGGPHWESSNRFMFIEHLVAEEIDDIEEPDARYVATILNLSASQDSRVSHSVNIGALRPLLCTLKKNEQSMAWLNMPESVADAVASPAVWVKDSAFRSVLMNLIPEGINNEKWNPDEIQVFDSILGKATIDSVHPERSTR